MGGGVLGLTPVDDRPLGRAAADDDAGDAVGIVLAFPLVGAGGAGPALATCRRSAPLCIVYVELIRGVPLISVLFMASFMFPLFMPHGQVASTC